MPSRYVRAVGAVGAWGLGPPDFYESVNTFSTRVADYAHHITILAPLRIFRLSYGPVCALQGFIVEGGRPPLTRACKNPFWQGKVKAMAFIGIFYLKANNVIFSQNIKCSKSGRCNKNYNYYSF